ncbi:response regulator transcription factor [Elizabethkingia anophelis]|uniref:DNA-binding response regulator n=1 Tax=Elizabethkingia anophelis TaxID=1117645 RepID=A0AAE4P3K5_9FLAO|nr:response regulator transcription factor [Elizabethkingia anophelis]MCT3835779.1 response regulator transcription factor [Elizabethkingia anophelis]MCT3978906.1 response regulator transcription factor [Elizabethkingia anophelis]MCT4042727.1 response regulator transcription factor [Elizabethkingia anophelis]MDV3664803.1 DNA-binding response regulator [Elizabethkingia anophelis]
MRILLLEDDLVLSSEISTFLASNDILCETSSDGEEFLTKTTGAAYDIYLLDINVPKINGLEVTQIVRETDPNTPIIIISAYDDISDKKEAFLRKADDYLVKPFLLEELLLRINSLLRRREAPKKEEEKIVIDDLEILPADGKVYRAGNEINLTVREFQLLKLLADANGRTLSKQHISDQVWQNQFQTTNNTIEVYINFLRKKIDKDFKHKLIHTRPGFGYYLASLK